MLWLLLIAQAATPAPPAAAGAAAAATAAAPTSFSILQPVADEPCVRRAARAQDPDDAKDPRDIVVCGKPLASQKLPFSSDVVLDEPRASNPYLRGTDALALEASPCMATAGGCTGGIDPIGAAVRLVRLVQKAVAPSSCCERPGEGSDPLLLASDIVHGVKHAGDKKPDTSRRIPIPLDDKPVSTAGKVLP